MIKSNYEHLNASSLVDLKAELYKKQEALKQAKANTANDENIKRKGLKLKGENYPKKVKLTSTQAVPKSQDLDENEKELQRSRLALERKAKLYDHILSRKVTLDDEADDADTYLVDFHRKLKNIEKEPICNSHIESELGDRLDDVHHPAAAVKNNNFSEKYSNFVRDGNFNPESPMIPQKNNETNTDGPVHYQNVQYNEVRDHGVGYFAFSTDEEKRKEEMESLHRLREQTEQKKAAFQNSEQKRKTALQTRLAKICERRNIDKSVIEDIVPKSDLDNASLNESIQQSNIDLNDIPLPSGDIPATAPPKPSKVRPWDEGKEIVNSEVLIKKGNKYSQKDWIEDRRSERLQEFAPPSYF